MSIDVDKLCAVMKPERTLDVRRVGSGSDRRYVATVRGDRRKPRAKGEAVSWQAAVIELIRIDLELNEK